MFDDQELRFTDRPARGNVADVLDSSFKELLATTGHVNIKNPFLTCLELTLLIQRRQVLQKFGREGKIEIRTCGVYPSFQKFRVRGDYRLFAS